MFQSIGNTNVVPKFFSECLLLSEDMFLYGDFYQTKMFSFEFIFTSKTNITHHEEQPSLGMF